MTDTNTRKPAWSKRKKSKADPTKKGKDWVQIRIYKRTYERLRALARDPDADGAVNIKAEERALVSARRAVAKARQTLLGIVTND